jgi:hypothetical protein
MRSRTLLPYATAVLALCASVCAAAPKGSPALGHRQERERGEEKKGEEKDSEVRVKMKDLPAAVQKTVREQSQGATVRGLSRETEDGVTNYEAELTVNGRSRDVLISPTGEVVEVEEQVTLDSLPAAVRTAIEQNARGGRVGVIESISKGGAVVAYEAHVRRGGRSREIKVNPEGQLITK